MKVKEITLAEDTYEVTTKPLPGATDIEVGGQSVGTAKDPQTAQTVAQAAKDGKLSLTPPGTQGGNSQAQVQEEPVSRPIPKVSIANPLQPMVMDNGNIKGTPLQKASGDITPELIARSAPDFEERYIEANGKRYLALATGTVFKVSPRDFAEITGLYHLPGNTNQKYAPAQNMPYNTNDPRPKTQLQHLEESAEVSRIKMLSGL